MGAEKHVVITENGWNAFTQSQTIGSYSSALPALIGNRSLGTPAGEGLLEIPEILLTQDVRDRTQDFSKQSTLYCSVLSVVACPCVTCWVKMCQEEQNGVGDGAISNRV